MTEPGTPQIHSNGPWGNAYTTEQIKHLREVFEGKIALLTQRMDAQDATLAVRKETVDQHLADLNNAHEKARQTAEAVDAKAEKIANLTLTKDKFEEFRLAQDAKAKAHETDMAATRSAQTVANRAVAISVAGWVIVVAGWVVQYFLRRP